MTDLEITETVTACRTDVDALVAAWRDRGMTETQIAGSLLGFAMRQTRDAGFEEEYVVTLVRRAY